MTNNRMIEKVTKLLNMAASAKKIGNIDEAKAFEEKANALMMQHSIEKATTSNNDDVQGPFVEDVLYDSDTSVGFASRLNFIAVVVRDLLGCEVALNRRPRSMTGWGQRSSDGYIRVCGFEDQIEDARVVIENLAKENLAGIKEAKKRAKSEGVRFSRISYDLGFFNTMMELARSTAAYREKMMIDNLGSDYLNTKVDTARVSEDAGYGNAIALRDRHLAIVDTFARRFPRLGGGKLSSMNNVDFGVSYQAGVSHAKGSNLQGTKAISA